MENVAQDKRDTPGKHGAVRIGLLVRHYLELSQRSVQGGYVGIKSLPKCADGFSCGDDDRIDRAEWQFSKYGLCRDQMLSQFGDRAPGFGDTWPLPPPAVNDWSRSPVVVCCLQ